MQNLCDDAIIGPVRRMLLQKLLWQQNGGKTQVRQMALTKAVDPVRIMLICLNRGAVSPAVWVDDVAAKGKERDGQRHTVQLTMPMSNRDGPFTSRLDYTKLTGTQQARGVPCVCFSSGKAGINCILTLTGPATV